MGSYVGLAGANIWRDQYGLSHPVAYDPDENEVLLTYTGGSAPYHVVFGPDLKIALAQREFDVDKIGAVIDSLLSRVGLEGEIPSSPRTRLAQNAPNPFNPTTLIEFEVPSADSRATLAIYDLVGRQVRVLVDEGLAPGIHRARWDGRDASGHGLPSGLYFYRLQVGSDALTRSMLLLK